MSDTNTRYMFDTKLILEDIEKVIQKGLNEILSNYMDRFILLEQTHRQLMNLPSVANELGHSPSLQINNNCSDNVITRLENMENKYDTMITLFDNLLSKVNSLNDNIIHNKNLNNNNNTIIPDSEEVKVKTEIFLLDEELTNESVIVREIIKNIYKQESEVEEQEKLNIDEAVDEEVEEEQHEESQELIVSDNVEIQQVVSELEQDDDVQTDKEDVSDYEENSVETETKEQDEDDSVEIESKEQEEDDSVEIETKEQEQEASVETETKDEEPDDEEDSVEMETKDEEPDDEELFEIEIDDKTYCTNNEENGFIWELTDDGEQGDKVGYLKDGEPFFYADEN